jgi:protein-L-isoaspartate(D-aspartate) O-methyltransferase
MRSWGGVTLLIVCAAATLILFARQLNRIGTGKVPRVSTQVTQTTQPDRDIDWPPKPRDADQRTDQRRDMVRRQIEQPSDARDAVRDTAVLEAMRQVPRHAFVHKDMLRRAYDDSPLPIGHGQTISQPYIVAVMTERLGLNANSKVLEIGTGSGYQAAVLAHLTPHVYSIEIIEALEKRARNALDGQGYKTVQTRAGDGYFGWPEAAPFDAIIVTAAAGHIPGPLWEQLAPGGRMVIPIGGVYEVQRLVVLSKQPDGKRRSETIMAVRFVPMTGRAQERD